MGKISYRVRRYTDNRGQAAATPTRAVPATCGLAEGEPAECLRLEEIHQGLTKTSLAGEDRE
jgi:hypothetical protein